MHLAIDGFGEDLHRKADMTQVHRFLDQYPLSLGMTKIYGPIAKYYKAPDVLDSGVSGFVIIAESHISIHTFPHRGYINVDIFSCRAFDSQRALRDVQEYFGLREVKVWTLKRGLEHLEQEDAPAAIARERAQIAERTQG